MARSLGLAALPDKNMIKSKTNKLINVSRMNREIGSPTLLKSLHFACRER